MVKFDAARSILVCFVLLYASRTVDAGCAAVVGLASSAISAGTSIAGTSIEAMKNDGYSVTCIIEVENWTKYSLVKPEIRIHRGVISRPPPRLIGPAKKEVMTTHNAGWWYATGTWGTVSWLIQGLNRRVYVMWSAPKHFLFYSNWAAVGLSKGNYVSHPSGDTVFNAMYHDTKNEARTNIGYSRHEYYDDLSPVEYSDDDIQVVGRMSNGHESVVEIDIVPTRASDLAPGIDSLPCLKKKK